MSIASLIDWLGRIMHDSVYASIERRNGMDDFASKTASNLFENPNNELLIDVSI